MLLQPDSELYLIPSAGGAARRLRGNTARMNSWHSWSPNGKWLVFSSKAYSPYTQLCLTHIDALGNSTPAVLLSHLSAPDRAANIPEFVQASPKAIARISEKFLDDLSHARAAYTFERTGDLDNAILEYQKALAINPRNGPAHQRLGALLYSFRKDFQNGPAHTLEALKINVSDGCAHFDLGTALLDQGKLDLATNHLSIALRLLPSGFDARYTPAMLHRELGRALLRKRDFRQAGLHFSAALGFAPSDSSTLYGSATALAAQGDITDALRQYRQAVSLDAEIDASPMLHDFFSAHYASVGQFSTAIDHARKALVLARSAGQETLAGEMSRRLELYQKAQRSASR